MSFNRVYILSYSVIFLKDLFFEGGQELRPQAAKLKRREKEKPEKKLREKLEKKLREKPKKR